MSMTLRLTEEQDEILSSLAAREGVSKNEAALRAILEKHRREDRENQIRRATDDIVQRYGPLLDRLAE